MLKQILLQNQNKARDKIDAILWNPSTMTMATTYKQNNKYSKTFKKLPIEIEITQANG